METFIQDLRYAVRQLARTPAFTIVAVLTLAVGIGANTALFTMLEAIFVRPLPSVRTDGRLVWISPYDKRAGHAVNLSYPDFVALSQCHRRVRERGGFRANGLFTFHRWHTGPRSRRSRQRHLLQPHRRPDGAGSRLHTR